MLSHQNPNIYPQHRRTNSTPAIAITPATTNLKHCMHQRGLTMDQTVYSQPQQYPQQDQGLYRNTNLPEKQYIIREAQQQDPTRPDQSGHESTIRASDTMTQNHFAFEASSKDTEYDTLSKLLQPGTVDNLEGFQCTTEQVDDEQNIDLEDLSRMIGWSEYHWQQAAGASHNDIKRPYTPPSQISSNYFPPSPAATPLTQKSRMRKQQSRTAESSPVRHGPTKTIKASHTQPMKRGSSCQDSFSNAFSPNRNQDAFSPPKTVPLPCSSTFDIALIPPPSFMNMSTVGIDVPGNNNGYYSPSYSPVSCDLSPTTSSFQSSPELAHLELFPELRGTAPLLRRPEDHQTGEELEQSISPIKQESLCHTQSISDPFGLSVDGTIEETGITAEEIASFVGEFQDDDRKSQYRCLWPDCGREFQRKENVRSHVQTHLGDRQFRCNVCKSRFVRQHDLKRHWKTHSGDKPFPCACGNSFARMDALTRHRQRGMCIGAFPGTPKKLSKRGRPKKNKRPDTEERREKAAKTRQRVLEKRQYASSVSGSSDYSQASPPQYSQDEEMCDLSPFDDLPDMPLISNGVSSSMFSYTPPESPSHYSTGNCFSPQQSQFSNTLKARSTSPSSSSVRLETLPEDLSEELPDLSSPAKSTASQYGTPPELVLSSSPVATRFFTFDDEPELQTSSAQVAELSILQKDGSQFDFSNVHEYQQSSFEDALSMASFDDLEGTIVGKFDSTALSFDDYVIETKSGWDGGLELS